MRDVLDQGDGPDIHKYEETQLWEDENVVEHIDGSWGPSGIRSVEEE